MTIEVSVIHQETHRRRVAGHVQPGEFMSFSNFASGGLEFISVLCLPDNSGGVFWRFGNEDFYEDEQYRAIPAELYTADRIIAEIPAGGKFSTDVVTKSRKRGRLILQHLLF